ncbi:unnamed protein product [Boreogadus saida]
MAHFHCRVRNGSDRKGAGRIAFPPPKVGVTRTLPYPTRHHSGDCSVAVPKTLGAVTAQSRGEAAGTGDHKEEEEEGEEEEEKEEEGRRSRSHLLPGSSGKRLISCPGLWEKVVLPGTAGVSEVNPPTRGRFTAME